MVRTNRFATAMLAAACTGTFCAAALAEDLYYYQGDHRVDLTIALDELDLRLAPGAEVEQVVLPTEGFGALKSMGRIEVTDQTTIRYRCTPRRNLDSLLALADQLSRSVHVQEVHPVCYDSGEALAARDVGHRFVLTTKMVARLHPGDDPHQLAGQWGATFVQPLPFGRDLYLFTAYDELEALFLANSLRETGEVLAAQPVVRRTMTKRFMPNDPLYDDQWYLRNTGQGGGTPGVDINVEPAWNFTRGAGAAIAIVDDGLETAHPDLAPNHDDTLAYDYYDDDSDPSPTCYQAHGTSVAGIAGARGDNGVGISGAAPEAALVGIRLLGGAISDVEEGLSLSHRNDVIAAYNNSWGPTDSGRAKQGPGVASSAAIEDSALNGRDGKGCVFVWAAGNGGQNDDNANYDGYVNSRYTIGVTAVTDGGVQPGYAEPGACILVNTPSGGGVSTLITTDLMGECGGSLNDYRNLGGTSAAAPQAAGAVALVLAANPDLTWRDVQHILVQTAVKNDAADPGWAVNGAGLAFNHKYGFGTIDAAAAVQAAQTWVNVAPEVSAEQTVWPALTVPDNDPAGVTSQITLSADLIVEAVEIPVSISTLNRGDLRIELESPDGTVSVLANSNSDTNNDYDWTFTSVQHWDESSAGTWTLRVIDELAGTEATLDSWGLRIWGTPACLDPTGDFDFDCDVDLADFAEFALCYAGSGGTIPPASCSPQNFDIADIDGDGDADLADFSTFALSFGG